MNTINWEPKALKQVEKIKEIATRQRFFSEAQTLADFPDSQKVKKLTSHTYTYRLRVGDFPVFFEFNGNVHIVSIEEVKKRDEHTY